MPGVEHVISFHAILSGSCWAALSAGSAPALNLNAGDVVVLPGGAPNVMGSQAGVRGKPDMAMYYKPVDKHLPFTLIRGGEGQERTRFVRGYLGCDARPFNPLLASLPAMLRVTRATDGGRWVTDLFTMALQEGGSGRAGGEPPVSGDDTVVDVDQYQSAGPDLRPEDRCRPSDLHAEPDPGASAVIFHIAVSRQPIVRESGW
jgi:hypothetical protein